MASLTIVTMNTEVKPIWDFKYYFKKSVSEFKLELLELFLIDYTTITNYR